MNIGTTESHAGPGVSDELVAGAAAYWDTRPSSTGTFWTEVPLVQEYVNTWITGVPWIGPTQALKLGWMYRPVDRGLSIGSGDGRLERDLMYLNVCRRIDALDISRKAIREAKKLNRIARVSNVHYRRADFNTLRLPREKYDMVFFHGSLHHVTNLEHLLGEVSRTLKPHGMVYIDEYVGPSRNEWSDEWLIHAREAAEKLPDEMKLFPVNPAFDSSDPSEMVRSSEIVDLMRRTFDVVHYKPYWGNLLYPLLVTIRRDMITREENLPLVRSLVEQEHSLVDRGAFEKPMFAVMVCRKRGWTGG